MLNGKKLRKVINNAIVTRVKEEGRFTRADRQSTIRMVSKFGIGYGRQRR